MDKFMKLRLDISKIAPAIIPRILIMRLFSVDRKCSSDKVKSVNYKIDSKTVDKINTIKVQDLDLLNPSLWK
jgi:hypothetical protein